VLQVNPLIQNLHRAKRHFLSVPQVSSRFFFPYGATAQSRLMSNHKIQAPNVKRSAPASRHAWPSDVAASTSHGSHWHPMATHRLIPPYPGIRITLDKRRGSSLATPVPGGVPPVRSWRAADRRRPEQPAPPGHTRRGAPARQYP